MMDRLPSEPRASLMKRRNKRMNDPINVALLGYGLAGKVFHAPLIASVPELRLHTVVSRDAGKVHADHPDVRVTADATEAFADPAIALVVIATPNSLHAPQARAALAHGKHVVVDKPFALDTAEARSVMDAATQAGRMLSVFHNRRWDADFLTVRRLLEDEALGEIVEFRSHFDRYRPVVQDRWREQDVPGSGLWFDLGPHLLDQALQLFGMPEAVYADITIQREGARVDDCFEVRLRYPTRRVTLHASALVADPRLRFALHGTRGSYLKQGLDTQEAQLRSGVTPGTAGWGHDPLDGEKTTWIEGQPHRETIDTLPGDYRQYYLGIHDALREGRPPPVTAAEALDVMRLLELAVDSNRERCEIPCPATALA